MHFRGLALFVMLSFLTLCVFATKADAIVKELATYFVGSELIEEAGEEYRRNLAETRDVAKILIGESSSAAAKRLSQIDVIRQKATKDLLSLVDRSEVAILTILGQASNDLQILRKDFLLDLEKILEEAVCNVDKTLNDHLVDALGGVGRLLNTNTIEITLPVKTDPNLPSKYFFWKVDRQVFGIQKPFDNTYIEIRDRLIENLERIEADHSAHIIVSTYSFISGLAARTACFSDVSKETYLREMRKFQRMSQMWDQVLDVDVNMSGG